VFGIKELKRQVAYLERDIERTKDRYWELSRKHDYLCKYVGVVFTEQRTVGYEAKGGPEKNSE
jgi:hypothetical protein